MQYYDLRFQLKHSVTDAQADEYGELGFFFDSTDGVPFVTVDVPGNTASGRALHEAHQQLIEGGLEVVRATPNLVSISSMANRFNVSRQAAQRWSKAEGFPLPVITDGTTLWHWPDVRSWVQLERGKQTFDDSLYPTLDEYTLFNASLLGAEVSPRSLSDHWKTGLYARLLEQHTKAVPHTLFAWNIGRFDVIPSFKDFTLAIDSLEPNFEVDLEEGGRFRARDQRV